MELVQADLEWVEKTLASLSLRERIGQLLLPCLTEDTSQPLTVAEMVEKYCIGGGHAFRGEPDERRAQARELQAAAKVPLLITGDLELGGGMALGAADDEELAYELGVAVARKYLAAGYNWSFSPVVDLCGIRDFLRCMSSIGEDPEQVARLACAKIRGLQSLGMAACAKHFPGDGFDDRDQHLTTSINPLPEKEWYRLSGYPFKKAIEAGVWSIMNVGIACPALDPGHGDRQFPRPSVISGSLTEGILRKELGFEGVIVTDAINMGGISMHLPWMERGVQALAAGNDMLLFARDIGKTVEYIERSMESGRLTEENIERSVRRVLTMKAKMGLHASGPEAGADPAPANESLVRRLAVKSITLLKDSRSWVPMGLKAGTRVAHVLICNRDDLGLELFETTLQETGCRVITLREPPPEEMYDRVEAGEFDVVLTSFHYRTGWGWGTPRLYGPHIRSIMSGYHLARTDIEYCFISWGSPYHLYEFACMDPFLVTYGAGPDIQKAAARMLMGTLPIQGRVPVSLPGFFERGEGIQRTLK